MSEREEGEPVEVDSDVELDEEIQAQMAKAAAEEAALKERNAQRLMQLQTAKKKKRLSAAAPAAVASSSAAAAAEAAAAVATPAAAAAAAGATAGAAAAAAAAPAATTHVQTVTGSGGWVVNGNNNNVQVHVHGVRSEVVCSHSQRNRGKASAWAKELQECMRNRLSQADFEELQGFSRRPSAMVKTDTRVRNQEKRFNMETSFLMNVNEKVPSVMTLSTHAPARCVDAVAHLSLSFAVSLCHVCFFFLSCSLSTKISSRM